MTRTASECKGVKLHGVVVFLKEAGDVTYGFIEPAGSDGSRENNVWFGTRATQGLSVERGDTVDYVLSKRQGNRPCLHAFRVFVRTPAVTTLVGEFDI
jgi:hypothetical protein